MSGALKTLRIDIDNHFRGSSEVPQPWVAQINGIDAKYGLARTFVQRLRDYRRASRSMRGTVRGVVAAFPLHDGRMYEVNRLRGKPSKRHVAREFVFVEDGKLVDLEPAEALARAEGYAGAVIQHVVSNESRISRVDRLGTPATCGFVRVGRDRGERLYRLRSGALHEVVTGGEQYLLLAGDHDVERISQPDALAYLLAATTSSSGT